MKAVVVYELHWGNTAAIAEAIAAGIGPGTVALTTDEASGSAIADADLIVAGAPVIAFRLATDTMLERLDGDATKEPRPADVGHPSMRHWLEGLEPRVGYGAAFETRVHWSPGGATGAIEHGLGEAGYQVVAKGRRFLVTGQYGPLRDGQLDAAHAWGEELAQAVAVMLQPAGATS